jgi:hypothetical protein
MAFNLTAVLRLRDGGFTNTARRVSRSISSLTSGVGSLTNSFLGLSAAIGGAVTAKKIFDETILAAAKYEQSTITISAILNDKELGKQYMDLVDRFAVDSPILNSQEMLANSKSFLTMIKDIDQLEKAWSIAERMAAIDPMQGTEGAVFALREMFSGDAISMVRRFEFPRAVMNEIKKLDIPEQLEALDKYFNSIGMTQKLIDDMGGTTLGIFAQIKEQLQVIGREIGMPALTHIKDFLDSINNGIRDGSLEGFKQTGARMLENLAQGFISAAKGIGSWVESIRNNPEFQSQTTLFGKVEWVINDVYAKFLEWLDSGGRDKISKVGSDLIQILIGAVEASMENIIPIATKIGVAMGNGVISGFKSAIESSWLAQLISDPVGYAMKWASGGRIDLPGWEKNAREKGRSSSAGLDRVPYNGFKINAHKDEMLLTKNEADAYRKNRGSGGGGVTITGNTFVVRQESDIDAIGEALFRRINHAREAGA